MKYLEAAVEYNMMLAWMDKLLDYLCHQWLLQITLKLCKYLVIIDTKIK